MLKKTKSPEQAPVGAAPADPGLPGGLSEQDEEALGSFCAQVDFEDVSFCSWQRSHKDPDLRIIEFLSPSEVRQGGSRQVRFTRTVAGGQAAEKPGDCFREKATMIVRWEPGNWEKKELVFTDKGDRLGERKGNLIIVFIVRNPVSDPGPGR